MYQILELSNCMVHKTADSPSNKSRHFAQFMESLCIKLNISVRPMYTKLPLHVVLDIENGIHMRLIYRRGTARRAVSVKTVLNVAQMFVELHAVINDDDKRRGK